MMPRGYQFHPQRDAQIAALATDRQTVAEIAMAMGISLHVVRHVLQNAGISPIRRRTVSIAKNFWCYVDQSAGPQECWPWTRGRSSTGYGIVRYDAGAGAKNYGAHVVALYLTTGRLAHRADGTCALHACDNPPCCNPAHLSIGSASQNSREMVARGRMHTNHARGEALPFARLSENEVLKLRADYAAGRGSQRELARRYGVSKTSVGNALLGQTWSHV